MFGTQLRLSEVRLAVVELTPNHDLDDRVFFLSKSDGIADNSSDRKLPALLRGVAATPPVTSYMPLCPCIISNLHKLRYEPYSRFTICVLAAIAASALQPTSN